MHDVQVADLMELYGNLAWCYDLITTGEEHEKEADFVKMVIKAHKRSEGNRLLDVGCGHGWHDYFLKEDFGILGSTATKQFSSWPRKGTRRLTTFWVV